MSSSTRINPTKRRVTSAHVLAALAVFISLGGSALAIEKASVKSKHIRDGAVKTADVKDGGLTGADLANASVSGAQVADNSLTGADVDEASLQLASGPAQPTGPAGGALTGAYPDPLLAPNSVSSGNVAQNALGQADLGLGSVGSSELLDESIAAADIDSSSVGSSELASGSVNASEVADGSLNGDDVGRESGTVSGFDMLTVLPNECVGAIVGLGVPDDLRADAIVVTPGTEWPSTVSLTEHTTATAGAIVLTACNPSSNAINPPSTSLHWVAFDV